MSKKSSLQIDALSILNTIPGCHLILLPDAPRFTIAGVTDSYLSATYLVREEAIGRGVFETLTDNPNYHEATGVKNLLTSLQFVTENNKEHRMADQRYDVLNRQTGFFEFKVWSPFNKPVLDEQGVIQYIIHTVEDITDKVRLQEENTVKGEQLSERESRIRHMVEQAPTPILLSRGEDIIIEILNEPMLRFMNKSSFDEVLGKKLVDTLPELMNQGILEILMNVQKTGVPVKGFEQPVDLFIDDQYERRYFNFSYTPLIEDGEITGMLHMAVDVTTQVVARRKVEEAKEELQFVTDTMPQLVWAAKANGNAYFFNKRWLAYTGLTLEEAKDNGWMQSLHPADIERTTTAWNNAFKGGADYEIEYRLKRYDGEYRWFLTRGTPMRDEQEQIVKWYGTTTDVQDQKIVEQALRESEERFRTMANTVPQSIWITDAEGRTEFLNQHWCDYCGEPYSDTTAADIALKYLHPEDAPKVMQTFTEAMQTGEPWEVEQRNRSKEGEYRWFLNRATPYRDPVTGNIAKWFGVGVDIHDRKLAEQALRRSEDELEQKVEERTRELEAQKSLLNNILTNSSNGISVTEMIRDERANIIDARTILANDAAVNYIGMPKEIFLSKTAVELDPNILSSSYGQTCLNTLRTGEPALSQYYMEITGRWQELTISKMDEDHLIHIFTDITPIKVAQLQLEQTVAELRRSNANLEEFAYAASHDLKEPVRKVHFFSEKIKSTLHDRMTEGEKQSFDRMELAAKRMNSLIDDLLSYSQISIRPRSFEAVSMNGLIALVLQDLDVEIEGSGATVTVDNLFTIQGHHRQLQQAFQNLIGNSLKYRKPHVAPEIKISCSKVIGNETGLHLSVEESQKTFYCISVRDNGIGFEQQDADRIFNVFTRLHGNAEYRGTGIGLSIVRKVVENHKGYIWAESTPGEGATFNVLFPIEQVM